MSQGALRRRAGGGERGRGRRRARGRGRRPGPGTSRADGVHVYSGTPDLDHHGDAALRIFEEIGDFSGQAHALNNLAIRRLLQGQRTESLQMFERAAGMFQRVGDAANEANASYNQADLLNRQGRYAEAAARLDRVLHVARAVGDEELLGLVLREQGRALSRDGRTAGAGPAGRGPGPSSRTSASRTRSPTPTSRSPRHTSWPGSRRRRWRRWPRRSRPPSRSAPVTLLPSAYRVSAAALPRSRVTSPAACRSLDQGLRLGSSPDLAHERGFLLVVAARAAEWRGDRRRGHAGHGGPARADFARRGPRAPAVAHRERRAGLRWAGSRAPGADVVVEEHHAEEVAGAVALALHRVQARRLTRAEDALRRTGVRLGERPRCRSRRRATSNFGTPPFEQSDLSHPRTNVAGCALS